MPTQCKTSENRVLQEFEGNPGSERITPKVVSVGLFLNGRLDHFETGGAGWVIAVVP